jgi:hypothetical protein
VNLSNGNGWGAFGLLCFVLALALALDPASPAWARMLGVAGAVLAVVLAVYGVARECRESEGEL